MRRAAFKGLISKQVNIPVYTYPGVTPQAYVDIVATQVAASNTPYFDDTTNMPTTVPRDSPTKALWFRVLTAGRVDIVENRGSINSYGQLLTAPTDNRVLITQNDNSPLGGTGFLLTVASLAIGDYMILAMGSLPSDKGLIKVEFKPETTAVISPLL